MTGLSGRSTFSLMITGHNTDVEYAGRSYHVQTEDKGRNNPVIESLIYSRGEILDSRRSSYADAIKDGYDEKIVIRLIEQQHGRMLREVRNGRFDPEGPKPFGWNLITNRELDEVVLEWLGSDRGGLGLRIELSDAYTFFGGSAAAVSIAILTGEDEKPVSGARVEVRLLDPRQKPAKLFEGETAMDGSVTAKFRIPDLKGAGGALVFRVHHGEMASELTRPVLSST